MAKYRFEQIAINSKEKKKPAEEDRFTYLGLEHLDSGSLRVTRFGSDVAPIGEKLVMHKGDVLFGKRRAYQKKVAIAPFDGIFSAHGMVLRPREEVVDKDFFPLFISSDYFLDAAIKISVGSLSPTINWRDLKELEFELPDLDTQRGLAKVLWSINDTMEAYKKLISATDELVKSQFIERFGDPITNPKGWPVMQLQDIVSDDCSISYGIVKPGDDVPDGVPVFRPVDIVGKKPEITELKRTSKAISDQYKRTLLTGRELLLTVRANIGDTCIIGDEFKGCNVGRGIVPIRVKEDLMSLEFLKCQMDFDTMHDYIQSLSKGITLIQLNMEDLRKIAFIVPPVDLQKEYLSIVRQSDKSKFELRKALAELTAMYKRIIQENLV